MVMLHMQHPDGLKTTADIFQAAANDDPDLLIEALDEGRSLNEVDYPSGFTPLMVAIISYSHKFMSVALTKDFDPWILDHNHRLAIDHACALHMKDIMRSLHGRMYPEGWSQSGQLIRMEPR